jgi:molybdate transport system substrate-binding protein
LIRSLIILSIALLSLAPAAAQPRGPLVLAAASLQESLDAASDAWAKQGHARPVISFAASSALARQVEAGAPADLFVSADEDWMNELAAKQLIVPASRVSFLGNRLVVASAAGNRIRITRANLGRTLAAGPVAMADVAVPAAKYGKDALTKLGAWDAVAPHVVRGDSVRAALALVERGAAPYGIVYATDARASPQVRIAGIFPDDSHAPITYPIARLAASKNPEGEGFRRFLVSRAGKAIFVRYGFSAR